MGTLYWRLRTCCFLFLVVEIGFAFRKRNSSVIVAARLPVESLPINGQLGQWLHRSSGLVPKRLPRIVRQSRCYSGEKSKDVQIKICSMVVDLILNWFVSLKKMVVIYTKKVEICQIIHFSIILPCDRLLGFCGWIWGLVRYSTVNTRVPWVEEKFFTFGPATVTTT